MVQRRFGKWRAGRGRLLAAALAITVFGVVWALPAAAAQLYRSEDVSVSLDTTVTVGASVRVADRDSDLVYIGNGGTSTDPTSLNADDGNLNYDKGDFYSANAKTTMELMADWRRSGNLLSDVAAFVRMNAFYDVVQNCRTCTQRNNLSSEARHRKSVIDGGVVGTQFQLLDAFLDMHFDAPDRLIDFRFGNQVLSWGESLFFQGGINTINSVDVAKIRLPGSELRDALVPAPIVRLSTDLFAGFSLETYYQFYWNRTQVDPVASYWATSDLAGRGSEGLFYGIVPALSPPGAPYIVGDPASHSFIPPIAPNPALPAGFPGCFDCTAEQLFAAGAGIPRTGDTKPPNQGQFGFALRYLADMEPYLTTEFGLYYIRYHAKTPTLGFDGIVFPANHPLNPTGEALFVPSDFFRDYAERVNVVGFSFSTEIFDANVSGEISFRPDEVLGINAREQALIEFGASPPAPPPAIPPPPVRSGGFVTEKKIQAQLSMIQTFGPSTRWGIGPLVEAIRADNISLTTEFALVNYPDLPDQCAAGSPEFDRAVAAGEGCIPLVANGGGSIDATSYGYQMLMRIEYTNPFDVPITLTPSVAWAHAIDGNSAVGGPFLEEQMAVTVGLELDYLETWGAQVIYGSFFGAGDRNDLHDRDFFSFSVSYAF